MKVTWFWMEAEVNSVSIVTNNVFGPRILTVASPYQLLQSTNKHMDTLASMKPKMIKKKKSSVLPITLNSLVTFLDYLSMLKGVTISGKVILAAIDRGTPT